MRKILERLEQKGAVHRVRRVGRAWVYRSSVAQSAMVRKEIRQFLDSLFDGAAGSLVAHLADMDELSLEDLREVEKHLGPRKARGGVDDPAALGMVGDVLPSTCGTTNCGAVPARRPRWSDGSRS